MTRVLTIVVACALLLISSTGAQTRDPGARPKATSRLSGRVVAADTGQPLRRAIVRLASPEQRENRTALTDAAGRYEFSDLPDGRYSLTAAKSGYVALEYGQTRVRQSGRPVDLRGPLALDKIDFRLPRGSVITGQVVDELGEPVAGARVQALQVRYVNGERRLAAAGPSAETWDTGEFRIWSLMPGDYYLSATLRDAADALAPIGHSGYAPNYYPGTSNVAEAHMLRLALGETVSGALITLTPTRLASVSGIAIDSRGQPVRAGLIVALQPRSPIALATLSGEFKDDGTFTMSGLAPGEYTLRATALGSDAPEMLAATFTVGGLDVTGVVMQPVRMARVTGRLTFDASGPVPEPHSVQLFVVPAGSEPMDVLAAAGSAVVNDDFSFNVVAPPGLLRLRATAVAQGFAWTLSSVHYRGIDVTDSGVELSPAESADALEVTLTTRTQEVSGVVTNARGELVTDSTVFVFAQDRELRFAGTRHSAIGRPDQDGRYALATLAPGEYFAIAVDALDDNDLGNPDYLEALGARATTFTLREGEKKVLNLKP
jgi:hypothetical protein